MALRFGVLISGGGSNLQAIIDAKAAGRLDAELAVVLSNSAKALGLRRAEEAGLATRVLSHRAFASREAFDQALLAELERHQVDWVVLAGFMRVLGRAFLQRYRHRVVNIHPALLPAFVGLHAQEQAFLHGVKVAGCTVHLVDEGTDTGPILAQATVPVRDDDSAETLRERILAEEHKIFPETLQKIVTMELCLSGRRAHFVERSPGVTEAS